MTRERLQSLLTRFPHLRIAVLGDLFLDKWLTVDRRLDEPSVETNLTAYQVISSRVSAGAAGTVLNNLSTLQVGTIYAVGFVGTDGDGWEVLNALQKRGIDTRYVIKSSEQMTPAYIKPMFLQEDGSAEESNRLDIRNRTQTSRSLERKIISHLRAVAGKVDAIIVLDQLSEENTGAVTTSVREEIARLAKMRPDQIIYADSRAFIHRFHHVIIKCNDQEAAQMALGYKPAFFSTETVFASMDKLKSQTGRNVFVTCNKEGVACETSSEKQLVPAVKQVGPIDVCGAGDACTAGIVSALCAGADHREAAFLGNLTAGVTVRKLGTTGTANQEEVLALYEEQFGEAAL